MFTLRLHFLGALAIHDGDRPLPKPATRKSQSLLAYLVCHRDRPQFRDRLVALFWGESPERNAHHSLATALWHIRRCLPEKGLILSDAHTLQFDPLTDFWLDVDAFEALTACDDIASSQAAVTLYQGDFLEDFYDDWVINERYRLQALFRSTLERLMIGQEAQGEHQAALATALRLLHHDPLREDAHRLAMRAYCRLGQRNAALEQYRCCQEVVQAELGSEPMIETSELYRAILTGRIEVERAPPLQPVSIDVPTETPSPSGRTPLEATSAAPLVGREAELARLQRCWQDVQADRGRLLLIGGESGIGKSRLIQAFADRLRWRGTWVLLGRCYEFERLLPYQPLAEVLQAALFTLTPDVVSNLPTWVLGEVARLVPQVLKQPALAVHREEPGIRIPPPIRSDQERVRLFDAVARFLGELTIHGALVIILEDLHWATETTLHLLHYLVRHLAEHPVLLLGSYRPEEMAPQHPFRRLRQQLHQQGLLELLRLSPLPVMAVEEMVAQMSGAGQPTAPLARRLHGKTEGNPFFILEIINALFETGVLRLEQGSWQGDFDRVSTQDLPLPDSVRVVIQDRVGRLDDESQTALQQAAVLGREFDFGVLNALRQEPEEATLEAMDELLRRHLIAEGRGRLGRDYAFTHHLIQEVVYAGIPQRRRQYLHARAAGVMPDIYGEEVETLASELAFHFRQGRLPRQALAWAEKASAQARQQYAIEEAVGYYGQALTLAREVAAGPERESDLLRQRAEVRLLNSSFDQGWADLEQALALAEKAGDQKRQAEVLLVFAGLYAEVGEFEATVKAAREAQALAEACGDERLAGVALRFEGQGLHFQGRSRQAIACAERACELLARVVAVEEEGWAHLVLATTHLDLLGQFDAARTHLALAHERFERSGCIHGRILADHFVGNAYERSGDYQSALEQYTQTLTDARRIGYSAQEAIELAHLAIAQAWLGDLDAAERSAQACRQLSRRLGLTLWEAYGTYWLGHVAHERGNLKAATESMEEALSLATQINYRSGIAFIKSRLSCLYRDLGAPSDLDRSLAHAEEAFAIASDVGSPVEQIRALSNQAMTHLALGQPAKALPLSEKAIALAGEATAEDFSQELLYNHAQVLQANGRTDEARRYLDRARADLMAKADRIRDPRLKRAFVENVRANREILVAAPGPP